MKTLQLIHCTFMSISHWSLRALIIDCLDITTAEHEAKTLQKLFWYLFFSCYVSGEACLKYGSMLEAVLFSESDCGS